MSKPRERPTFRLDTDSSSEDEEDGPVVVQPM